MSDANLEVVKWLREQRDWLQQAAELLLEKRTPNDADIVNLAERLKTPEGQAVTTGRTFAGLTQPPNQTEELRLVSIGAVEGIEQLAPHKPLAFGDSNLSVIFGLNGSGKSGYTRILKRACDKPGSKPLKSNVYTDSPARRQCTIIFKLGTNERPTVWNADRAAIPDLRAVDFFDSDAANSYLVEESGVSYQPSAVELLQKLADICTRVRDFLKSEQDKLPSTLPALPAEHADTEIGKRYGGLAAGWTDEQVIELTAWTASHQAAFDRLSERLSAADPTAMARQKRETRANLLALAGVLKVAARDLSEDGLTRVRTAREVAAGKRKAAQEAAKVTTSTPILDGVGSVTWQAMWKAARAYSVAVAYPKQDFPRTDNEARCVLCQQVLTEAAAQRLQDFEQYVQGRLEKEATAAEAAYTALLESLPGDFEGDVIQMRCTAAGVTAGDAWCERIVDFGRAATDTIALLKEHEVSKMASALASADKVLDELARRAKAVESEAAQLDKDAAPEGVGQRDSAVRQQKELNARKWILEQANAVLAEVERLRKVAALERLRGLANSAPVSNKATRVSEEVVTQAYADRFNAELKGLAGAHQRKLNVELHRVRTERGQVLHQLRLTETKVGTQRPVEVLSEGERRVVSLAAFLADVADKPYSAPFVFDDPISSLDHEFEENVAKRLASLAKKRQVLVFTHRLSLLNALNDAAPKGRLAGISAFAGTTGHPDNSSVWTGKTESFNNQLLDRARKAKKAGDDSGPEAYKELARGVCTDFRRLVERTVEDDLLNKIVIRHRHDVQTKNKLAALARIEPADCKHIDELMSKYSKYLHSQSVEELPDPPEPDELIRDIEGLITWRKEFIKKCSSASL